MATSVRRERPQIVGQGSVSVLAAADQIAAKPSQKDACHTMWGFVILEVGLRRAQKWVVEVGRSDCGKDGSRHERSPLLQTDFLSSRTPNDMNCCPAEWKERAAPTLTSQRESALIQGPT